jgi:hypothetical protein
MAIWGLRNWQIASVGHTLYNPHSNFRCVEVIGKFWLPGLDMVNWYIQSRWNFGVLYERSCDDSRIPGNHCPSGHSWISDSEKTSCAISRSVCDAVTVSYLHWSYKFKTTCYWIWKYKGSTNCDLRGPFNIRYLQFAFDHSLTEVRSDERIAWTDCAFILTYAFWNSELSSTRQERTQLGLKSKCSVARRNIQAWAIDLGVWEYNSRKYMSVTLVGLLNTEEVFPQIRLGRGPTREAVVVLYLPTYCAGS